ncbi:MAG: hypothetical protein GY763_00770 [Gammaproteobacteria bacterium]|nr:hypothetical protein [Gammaproteobacteria bacterium]
MQTNFAPIGQLQASHSGDNSFWPSFTDIMMVVTMIFLMATSLLVVRNWQLVAELQESIAAEQLAAQLIQSTSEENLTLEERLANAEQSNSILRLRILKKDEELLLANQAMQQQEIQITSLEIENADFKQALNQANELITAANLEIEQVNMRNLEIEKQVANLSTQITRQKAEGDVTKKQLASALSDIASLTQSSQTLQQNVASLSEEKQLQIQQIANLTQEKPLLNQQIEESSRKLRALESEYLALRSNTQAEIESLTQSGMTQQQNISSLTQERQLLNQEIETYNRQLLTLKGEYDVVKSKYEELIKPARSPKGKYIAEVYYIKGKNGKIIRYKQPGDRSFADLPLSEVEKRLSKLKTKWGKDLYVKIIIPQDSGLTYSEAWNFMRNLLVKYDYYHQE